VTSPCGRLVIVSFAHSHNLWKTRTKTPLSGRPDIHITFTNTYRAE